jgi:8-oxo-dGTP diphosphatase
VRDLRIVTAVVRRDDRVLMVLQAGPGEEPAWTVPGGAVEPGEFVTDTLARELREETGLELLDAGRLAFSAQVDDRQGGWFADVWAFDVAAWDGELQPEDPDGLILEAAWVPTAQALERLERISWQSLTARYVRGELEPGSLWLRRVHEGGREEWLGSFGPSG